MFIPSFADVCHCSYNNQSNGTRDSCYFSGWNGEEGRPAAVSVTVEGKLVVLYPSGHPFHVIANKMIHPHIIVKSRGYTKLFKVDLCCEYAREVVSRNLPGIHIQTE